MQEQMQQLIIAVLLALIMDVIIGSILRLMPMAMDSVILIIKNL
jgi:hypothetical protein